MVASKALLLALIASSLAAARPQGLTFQHDDASLHLQEDEDVARSYPIDAQRLVHSTPRLMPGFYDHLVQQQRELLNSFNASAGRRRQHAKKLLPSLLESLRSTADSLASMDGGLSSKMLAGVMDLAGTASSLVQAAEHDIYEPASVSMPLDHFDNTTQARFDLRYFYSLRHYVPASQRKDNGSVPVFILDSGEADAEARLPFLEQGILDILARETGGIGIVLEHRFYGKSIPNRADLGPGETWGPDQLEHLNNRQALEDNAEFVRRLKIAGTENGEPRKVIYYGGSYPGGRSAHMRVLYPDLIHGAIASSAVVTAIDEFPEYFYPIARGAEPSCSQAIQAAIASIDKIIAPDPHAGSIQPSRNAADTKKLLDLFGLADLSEPADLANLLTFPLGAFQSLNWDGNVTSTEFCDFCKTLTTYGVKGLPAGSKSRKASDAGLKLAREAHAYAKFVRDNYVTPCLGGGGGNGGNDNPSLVKRTAEDCFGSSDVTSFVEARKLSAGKAWTYQYCTTWGYIMTAPPVPEYSEDGQLRPSGPKLVSTLLDYRYAHEICSKGFPDGQRVKVPDRPKVAEVNALGGFNIAKDRLAFVDGQYDPWRPATVHSEEHAYGGARADTLDRPFKLIPHCWHHCDENGVKDPTKTPRRVQKIHEQQIEFVKHWLSQE